MERAPIVEAPPSFACFCVQRYEIFRKLFAIALKKLQCLTKSPRQRYGKGHKKALGKARNQRSLAEGKSKSGAEGESLKLLKESGAIFLVHIHFVFVFAKLCLLFGTHKEKAEKPQKGVLHDF